MLIRPGSDAALALAMIQVIVAERLYDADFVAAHTIGFEELSRHVDRYNPEWASARTGIAADRIVALARAYGTIKPAMIVLGGSSVHKGANAWHAARAVSCLPALIGSYGIAGGGLGPRHGALAHGGGFATIGAADKRPPGNYIPNQMSEIAAALVDGRLRVSAALWHQHAVVLPGFRTHRGWPGQAQSRRLPRTFHERDDPPLC